MTSEPTRLQKLRMRLTEEGAGGTVRWMGNWALWNTGLHRALSPTYVETLQEEYLYSKRVKKYGIREPIIVYQMGKVGSASMYISLKALQLNVPVYHLHFLSGAHEIAEWAKQTLREYDQELKMVALSERLRAEIDQGTAPRYNLVSLVRTPIPRNLSTYFHNVESYFPNFLERFDAGTLSVQEIADHFLNDFVDPTPMRWFDEQVRDVFGLDVYTAPFPRERGYQVYENDAARLLVLRLEDLNRVVRAALHEFLNIPEFTLLPANIAEDKRFGAIYKELLAQLRLPDDFIQEMNGSRYARHFYSDDELEASVARWRAKA